MSRTIQLTPRLRMVADLLPRDVVLVDVGTDHAYLPAVLLLEGKIRGAIAADLRPGGNLAERGGRRSHRGDGGRNDCRHPGRCSLDTGHGDPIGPSAHVVYGGPEGVAGDPRLPD